MYYHNKLCQQLIYLVVFCADLTAKIKSTQHAINEECISRRSSCIHCSCDSKSISGQIRLDCKKLNTEPNSVYCFDDQQLCERICLRISSECKKPLWSIRRSIVTRLVFDVCSFYPPSNLTFVLVELLTFFSKSLSLQSPRLLTISMAKRSGERYTYTVCSISRIIHGRYQYWPYWFWSR